MEQDIQEKRKAIPKGLYCYDDWDVEVPQDAPDDFPASCLSLLWDQVKECGINIRR